MASTDSPVTSPVTPPPPGWSVKMPREERLFMWLILTAGVLMAAFSIAWLYFGDQNVPTKTTTTTTDAWSAKVGAWLGSHSDAKGRAVVRPGEEGYVAAFRYGFLPETIVVKAGQPVTLNISSLDALHGWSIVGDNQNISLEIAPRHVFKTTFTPDKPGTYLVVCNEYCGLQHHQMKGRIIAEK